MPELCRRGQAQGLEDLGTGHPCRVVRLAMHQHMGALNVPARGRMRLPAQPAVMRAGGGRSPGLLAQGSIEATEVGVTTTVGAFIRAPLFPSLPDDFCPIGYQLVRVSPTGAAFTAGTTQWAASGITCGVIKNVATLPGRPQIA